MKKPKGIILLSAFHILLGIFSLMELLSLSSVVSINGHSPEMYQVYSIVAFSFNFVIAYMLLAKKFWGWVLSLVFIIYSLLSTLFELIGYGLEDFYYAISRQFEGSIAFSYVLLCLIAIYILLRNKILLYFNNGYLLKKKTTWINMASENKSKALWVIALLHSYNIIHYLYYNRASDLIAFFDPSQIAAEANIFAFYYLIIVSISIFIFNVGAVSGILMKRAFGWYCSMAYFMYFVVDNIYSFVYREIYLQAIIGMDFINGFGMYIFLLLLIFINLLVICYLNKDFILDYFRMVSRAKWRKFIAVASLSTAMFIIREIAFLLLFPR